MLLSVMAMSLLLLIVIFSIFVANLTNIVSSDSDILMRLVDKKNYRSQLLSNKTILNIDNGSDHLMWFIQISDLHISIFSDKCRIKQLEEFANLSIDVIKPSVVLATGDLTDAQDSTKYKLGSRQYKDEWQIYRNILQSNNISSRTIWLDIRGNHDYFNVPNINSNLNYFSKYSAQGSRHQRSYVQQISANSATYSFIAVDASLEPGPKRPFNFIGLLDINETNRLTELSDKAHKNGGNYTIWFGHYPTSCIISPGKGNIPIRDLIGRYDQSFVYLSGHLHTQGGLVPHMYTMQKAGFLELELGDWKDNRLFRLAAFDHGLFSFVDVAYNEWPIVLITNPKHALFNIPHKENILLQLNSSYIRLLIFSPLVVKACYIQIDDFEWQFCNKVTTSLYALQWVPKMYEKGIHYITAHVTTSNGRTKIVKQPFSLDGTRLSFDLLARFALMINAGQFFQSLFAVAISVCTVPLITFRIVHELIINGKINKIKIKTPWIRSEIRKMLILSSINRLFLSLLIYCIYILIGPWGMGEIIDNHFGIIFVWGIFVNDSFLPGTLTYMYGFLQLVLCQIPLTFVYANAANKCYLFYKHGEKNTFFKKYWISLPFVVIITIEIILALFLWWTYGTLAFVFGPLRTWTVMFHIILWYFASNLPKKALKDALEVW